MSKELNKLFEQYEDNLLNYFVGMTPEQSKTFNKSQKELNKKKEESNE
tara:strand:+ start:143 stop:286 length:144 start_codon:yes stop_codon:yes gene_type:complete